MLRHLIHVSTVALMSSCALMAGCLTNDEPSEGAGAEEGKAVASGILTVTVGPSTVQYGLMDSAGQGTRLNLEHIKATTVNGADKPTDWRTASGSPVEVFGKKNADGSIDVESMQQSTEPTQTASRLVTTGTKRVLVLNVNFGGGTVGTDQDVRNVMTASARHFADASFGKMSLEFDVRSGININFGKCGDEDRWMNEAKAAAQKQGVNLSTFQHFEIFGKIDCGYGGLGQQPGTLTWIAGLWPEVVIHELGHNFGNFHAASRSCTQNGAKATMSDSCTFEEYGDPFDPMGHGGNHHYNANYKVNMGWIPAANVKLASGDQGYTILPMTAAKNGLQLLRVQGPKDVMYQVEFRQPSPEDKFNANDANVHGVLVHAFFTQASDAGRAHLLDMSPDGNFNIAALQDGKAYQFFGTNTTLTVTSSGPDGAVVRVGGAAGDGGSTPTGATSLAAAHSNKCIGVSYGSKDNAAKLVQWPCTGAPDQSWDIQDQGNNVVVLKNINSGRCLDVPGSTTDHAAPLQQWDCNGSNAQKWTVLPSNDTMSLRSLASNLCIDVNAWSTADGAPIIQWDCHAGANQEFRKR